MIRVQTKVDYTAVQNLARQAFWNLFQQGADEHFIIHNLRNSKDFIPQLSLLVEEDGEIIAHIAYSHSKVTYDSGKILETATFGPISVLPSRQFKGVGSTLIKYSIEKAKSLGFKAIIIMGHPPYYSRFGFKCIKQANICLGDGISYKCCMFLELQPEYLTSNEEKGVFKQSDQMDIKQEQLEQFDKNFPPKEKFQTLSQKQFQIVSKLHWNDELPPNPKDAYNRQKLA